MNAFFISYIKMNAFFIYVFRNSMLQPEVIMVEICEPASV